MHIHKPKALRNVRDVLGEVGIIVVGIVIALVLEQAVEWLHWHEQVKRTEAALQAELKTNLVFAYERRVLDKCVNDRIAFLRDRLLGPGPRWVGVALGTSNNGFYKKTAMPPVFGIPFRPRRMEAWQTALASGVLNYMPSERVAIYARIYDQIAMMKQTQDAEISALHEVGGLAFDRDLTMSDRTSYLDRLETIANLNRMMVGQSGQLLHAPFTLGPMRSTFRRRKRRASWAAYAPGRGLASLPKPCRHPRTPRTPSGSPFPDERCGSRAQFWFHARSSVF